MPKIKDNQKGFGAIESLLVILILVIIGFGGYYVWHTQHTKTPITTTASVAAKSTSTPAASTQQYLTIKQWGVRVPYQLSDTLSVSNQTCYNGDVPNIGCWVTLTSQKLANVQGTCGKQSLAKGSFGYIERENANQNYSATDGSGYEPATQYASENTGQYSLINNYYYFFAPLGNNSGVPVTGAPGCAAWDAQYNSELSTIAKLMPTFESIN